jgi:hypothetical protein
MIRYIEVHGKTDVRLMYISAIGKDMTTIVINSEVNLNKGILST